jgi:hypothetical protein
LGQTASIKAVQSPQKVHSKLQMNASPSSDREEPHFSHFERISSTPHLVAVVSGVAVVSIHSDAE